MSSVASSRLLLRVAVVPLASRPLLLVPPSNGLETSSLILSLSSLSSLSVLAALLNLYRYLITALSLLLCNRTAQLVLALFVFGHRAYR